jgi:copper homeostasis protein
LQGGAAHGARGPLPRVVTQPQIRPAASRLLEICLDSVESAVAAERGGADRVELCAGLPEGGTTPSAGMIAAVRRKISIGLQVMIRPRGGDFHYSDDEFGIMQRDILIARQLGASGVVFGLLTLEGRIDRPRMQQLIALARPLQVTCHRAFDMSADFALALDDLIELGVDRVLTSGGQRSAIDAMPTLKQIVQQANARQTVAQQTAAQPTATHPTVAQQTVAQQIVAQQIVAQQIVAQQTQGRISVMACGEISISNVKAVVNYTGVTEVHAGLGESQPSAMRFRNSRITMGSLPGSEYQRTVVSEASVRELRAALDSV